MKRFQITDASVEFVRSEHDARRVVSFRAVADATALDELFGAHISGLKEAPPKAGYIRCRADDVNTHGAWVTPGKDGKWTSLAISFYENEQTPFIVGPFSEAGKPATRIFYVPVAFWGWRDRRGDARLTVESVSEPAQTTGVHVRGEATCDAALNLVDTMSRLGVDIDPEQVLKRAIDEEARINPLEFFRVIDGAYLHDLEVGINPLLPYAEALGIDMPSNNASLHASKKLGISYDYARGFRNGFAGLESDDAGRPASYIRGFADGTGAKELFEQILQGNTGGLSLREEEVLAHLDMD